MQTSSSLLGPLRLTLVRHSCKRLRSRSFKAPNHSRAWSSSPILFKATPTNDPPISESTQDLLNRLEREARLKKGFEAPGSSSTIGGAGKTRNGQFGPKRVGPFPMGNAMGVGSGPDLNKTWAKWGDLGVGGKVARLTRQTGNLTVILLGGTLFVVLTYALTSELFAANSPTVLQNRSIDMITRSPAVAQHLLPPYTFTHTSSGLSSSRRTSPIQSQVLRHPRTGKEHLILRFYVHGRGIDEPEKWGWVKRPLRELKTWTWDPAYRALMAEGDSRETSGTGESVAIQSNNQKGDESGSWFGGLFGSLGHLRPASNTTRTVTMGRKAPPPAGTYKNGEARADFVKRAVVYWGEPDDVAKEGLMEGKESRMRF